MNKEWSMLQKEAISKLGKKGTFEEGKKVLFELRDKLLEMVDMLLNLSMDNLSACPLMNSEGYESKTILYSYYHIARIEDICLNQLVMKKSDIYTEENFKERLKSSIKTTGNELVREEIVAFSKELDKEALRTYIHEVDKATRNWLNHLAFEELKTTFTDNDAKRLEESGAVSKSDKAFWLIEFWCSKDIYGLLKMPFSRHWIMHVEASLRIKEKLVMLAKKNTDQISYCGHDCRLCYLGKWCGGCRSTINCCSMGPCSEGGICPNVKCAKERGLEGCYMCQDLEECQNGYHFENDKEAKGAALFIRTYGKKKFFTTLKKAIAEGMEYPKEMQNASSYQEACSILEKYLKKA